jgi:putative heme-binding domain-containing protein
MQHVKYLRALLPLVLTLSIIAALAMIAPSVDGYDFAHETNVHTDEVENDKSQQATKAAASEAANSNESIFIAAQAKPNVKRKAKPKAKPATSADANSTDFAKYAIYQKTAPRAPQTKPVVTTLPLQLKQGERIALIGNTLIERTQQFGYLESLIQKRYAKHKIIVRNLAWPGDTPSLQPRPANFADTEQHLFHEKADVIFAAFGFNESFAGKAGVSAFKAELAQYVAKLKTQAFNGKSGPRIVLLSPVAGENVEAVKAADNNNANIKLYADAIQAVAIDQQVGYIDVFTATEKVMSNSKTDLTFNGVHMTEKGYNVFAQSVYKQAFGDIAPSVEEKLRLAVIDKARQFNRRFRPVNTYYYTGNRNKSYGYLDFLPAMRNFEIMTANRDKRIWAIAQGKDVPEKVDDSNVPLLPTTKQSRGANKWMSAKDELKSFKVDPRFDVTLFAGEEQFPDIAAPIQMRWDSKGRLWVSCSTTYPHIYPGNEPNDKLVILEDTDGDGKADKSTVFADNLHIPLSFEFGDGGVYVSQMPHLTFIKDTDGDDKADLQRIVLTGFGTEDSHHALHDIAWTPDGTLIFRESVFHHTQVETPYGPVRQQNSGWFRYEPATQRLTSFGTYSSTNPWGVTFDDWGQHQASHPIYAAAFHALDPPYPTQHPRPSGLRAYSGTCGAEFIDFNTFPDELLKGHFIKVRYKPTNRVEIHKWVESEFGYDEQYVSDLIFSSNLSFIPVDLRYGPRGAMYVCDWYNPVKGHAQYSLRDDRRDRHSGRIWRITAKGKKLTEPPKIAGASIEQLLDIHKRPEYRYRYWAKREIREHDAEKVKTALDKWIKSLSPTDPRFRHHQIEAVWLYRNIGKTNTKLLREILACDNHHARAAAVEQLRYWHVHMEDAITLLRKAVNDDNGIVRMQGAIAASYIGTKQALDAMLEGFNHPAEKHVAYAFTTALGSHTLQRHWKDNPDYNIASLLKKQKMSSKLREPNPSASQAQFDSQKNLQKIVISCLPDRMKYSKEQFAVKPGQPVKLVFKNGDATDHNLVIVTSGALEEVGIAANDMAKDPKNANSDFVPKSKRNLIVQASPMIGPNKKSQVHVMRFTAPSKPGLYPYVCTFPGHWVVMTGVMVVADTPQAAEQLLATRKTPTFVKDWKVADLAKDVEGLTGRNIMRGMKAFMAARCNQCHALNGHGSKIGPDLTEVSKQFKGAKLLQQILEPSAVLNEKYQAVQIETKKGERIIGVVKKEDKKNLYIIPNLLNPNHVVTVNKRQIASKTVSKVSSMPPGLATVLTKEEIKDLIFFLEQGGYKIPNGLKHGDHKHN